MMLDTPTLIAIIIALAGSSTVMIFSTRRISELEKQNKFLKNRLKGK